MILRKRDLSQKRELENSDKPYFVALFIDNSAIITDNSDNVSDNTNNTDVSVNSDNIVNSVIDTTISGNITVSVIDTTISGNTNTCCCAAGVPTGATHQ